MRGQIPDLAPLAVFAPQLANVHGRVDADITVAGTVQAPELSGVISGAELAADIPAIGLKLKEGQLQARPAPSGEITVDGSIVSGDGRLQFNGKADRSGRVDMHVGGERVLAADIPGARVIVTPDLTLVRNRGAHDRHRRSHDSGSDHQPAEAAARRRALRRPHRPT